MEALYLLGSIVYNSITSAVLSFLIPLKSLCAFISGSAFFPWKQTRATPVTFYEGRVWHERRHPVVHAFEYKVRYALIDLDIAAESDDSLSYSIFRNHVSADEARRIAGTNGSVLLLTIPTSVGYEQNPLSVYYCFDLVESTPFLKKCIAEVTNTPWGERIKFVFNPSSDLVAKPLHVSPFMKMDGNWKMRADVPMENLFISISVEHPHLGKYFSAILRAKKVGSSLSPLNTEWFFWLMPHKVSVSIYWQALKLWWKNVPFIQHPRYTNQNYKEEAIQRDSNMRKPQVDSEETSRVPCDDCSNQANATDTRYFSWKDASWPWS